MNDYPAHIANDTRTTNLQQMGDEEFWSLAQSIADATPEIQIHSEEFLLCECGQVHTLLSLTALRELVPSPPQFTLLPDMPLWMLGLTAWRGEIIAVIDLEAYLLDSTAASATPSMPGQMLLIVQEANALLGLFVSSVGSTMRVDREEIHLPPLLPSWVSPVRASAIKGVHEELLVLDVPFILTDVLS